MLTLDDSSTLNAGSVKGEKGDQGDASAAGNYSKHDFFKVSALRVSETSSLVEKSEACGEGYVAANPAEVSGFAPVHNGVALFTSEGNYVAFQVKHVSYAGRTYWKAVEYPSSGANGNLLFVGCMKLGAALRISSAKIDSSSSDVDKAELCIGEFGADYSASSWGRVLAAGLNYVSGMGYLTGGNYGGYGSFVNDNYDTYCYDRAGVQSNVVCEISP